MNIKEKTQKKLESKIQELERLIATKGVGSGYLAKMERIQRNINLALFLGATATVLGLSAWFLLNNRDDEE